MGSSSADLIIHINFFCRDGERGGGKHKRTKHANITDDDKLRGQEQEDSEEEAEFEATPRVSKWGESAKGDLHYLLPLKGEHGRLIQQEPTHIPTSPHGTIYIL